MYEAIRSSDIMICDLTEQHPSVFVAAVLLLRVIINGIADVFNLNEDEASASFTNKVMSKIGHRKFTVPKQQKYFIFSIAAFITILCLVIIGFSISAIISTSSPVTDSLNVLETVSVLSGGFVDYIKQIVSGKGLSILGSIFSLVIIISGYFFFEMQKRAKANLGNGHHI